MWRIMLDILCEIFAYLPTKDLYNVILVNKKWCKAAQKLKQGCTDKLYSIKPELKSIYDSRIDMKYPDYYELLLCDAKIKREFTATLRNIISNDICIGELVNKNTFLINLLSSQIHSKRYDLAPFNIMHINYILLKIIKKYNTHSLDLCSLQRRIIFAYLFLINKFSAIANLATATVMQLPADFDFELAV